jgi:hypothetical protein
MPLYIRKNPNPATLLAKAYASSPPDGYEPSTEEAAAEWVAAQLAAGWVPVHPAPEPQAPEPRDVSKLTLRRRIRALGKEAQFDAALDAMPNARADWDDAQNLRTDDPLFTTYAPQFKTALDLTDAQFDALLAP